MTDPSAATKLIAPISDLPVRSNPIRIVIAEDQRFVADALQALLSRQPGMVVVGTVGSVVASLPLVLTLQPDVVIVELRPSDEISAAVRTIQERSGSRVIFLTQAETESGIAVAIESGASALLNLSTAADDVIHAIRVVADGETLITPQTIASVLNRRRKTDGLRDKLTRREREVLSLMSEGSSNREIAKRMGISYTTVRSHLRNVAGKLAAHSKLEVLVKAQRLELIGQFPVRARTSLS